MKPTLLRLSFLISILVCGLSFESKADHLAGAEVTYKCTSTPGIFEITLVVYQECGVSTAAVCNGACGTACSTYVDIMGADPSCQSSIFGRLTLNLVNVRDVDSDTKLCASSKNTCTNMGCAASGTFSPSFERYEFKGNANIGSTSGIPASCCKVRFVYSVAQRNGGIMTGASYANLYVDATVNRCLAISPCNSSPVFTIDPRMVICNTEPFSHNMGAIDPDGDSLSFAFAPALQGFNSPVSYLAPFAYNRPMPWTGNVTDPFPTGIHCDPLTGDFDFTSYTSSQNFRGIVVIEVTQWKTINGLPTIIGTTRSDFTMIVGSSCLPNHSPFLVTNPSSNNLFTLKKSWLATAGNPLCFTLVAKDADFVPPTIADTSFLSWDSSMVKYGASFLPDYNAASRQANGPREDMYKFCWTPQESHVRNVPYYFSIYGRDNKCPNVGKINHTFSIKVVSLNDIGLSKTGTSCGLWKLNYVLSPAQQTNIRGEWKIAKKSNDPGFANGFTSIIDSSNISPVEVLFESPGKYYIEFHAGSVEDTSYSRIYHDSVVVNTIVPIEDSIVISPIICRGYAGTIQLNGRKGLSPYEYKMDTLSFSNNNIYYNRKGTYIATIKDANGCMKTDTITLTEPDTLTFGTEIKTTCNVSSSGVVTLHATGGKKPYQYNMSGNAIFGADSVFRNLGSGGYLFYVKDNLGCIQGGTATFINPPHLLYVKDKITSPISCYGMKDGSIRVQASGGKPPYLFRLDSGLFSPDTFFSALAAKVYKITVKDSLGCTDSSNVSVPLVLKINLGPITGDSILTRNDTQSYHVSDVYDHVTGFDWTWGISKGHINDGQHTSKINVTWDSSGTGALFVKCSSSPTCYDSLYKTIFINDPTGLKTADQLWGLQLFPNPTKDLITISFKQVPQHQTLQLYDSQGKLILKQELKSSQQLNLEKLTPGIYILRIGEWSGQVIRE